MKALLTLMLLACTLALPSMAKDEDAFVPTEELAPEELKAQHKADKVARKAEKLAKQRAKLKFKWYKSVKKGLAAAEKNHTTCFILYTDPTTCKFCAQLEEEILDTKEFKSATGIGCGVMTKKAVEEYDLGNGGMPSAVIVGPDGKLIKRLHGYRPGMEVDEYLQMLRDAQPGLKGSSASKSDDEEEADAFMTPEK